VLFQISSSNARQEKFRLALIELPIVIALIAILDATPLPAPAAPCIIDWNETHQQIDGFGGGVVFLVPASLDPVTASNMDTLFLTNTARQLGLTLIRIRIDSSTNWGNGLLDGQNAVARGAQILATPWSPPAGMKSNANIVGGSLPASQYGNYANYDYELRASTNLMAWRTLLTTNPPSVPLSLIDPNLATNFTRFYRIQVGP
jgi:O-glycosyl hydrolase